MQRSTIGLIAAASRKLTRAVVALLCGLPLQKWQTMKASVQVSIGFQTPVRFTPGLALAGMFGASVYALDRVNLQFTGGFSLRS